MNSLSASAASLCCNDIIRLSRQVQFLTSHDTYVMRHNCTALMCAQKLAGKRNVCSCCSHSVGQFRLLLGVNRITYWSQSVAFLPRKCQPPSTPLDNIRDMVIVLRLRGNIIRTAPCWVVWYNVHSQQHTHMSSSYRSIGLGLSHWDPYAMHRGGCLELYYCNMMEWCWCDSSLIWKTN